MERDFEDIHRLDELSDAELRDLVLGHLAQSNAVDHDDLTVEARNGAVVLGGRVGTEAERRVVEHIVTDQLGVSNVENGIFVDPIRRAESPEAADDHLVEEERAEGLLLGDRAVPISPEVDEVREDLDADTFGSTDVQRSIAQGTAWIPPESPTPEGLGGTASDTEDMGEDH